MTQVASRPFVMRLPPPLLYAALFVTAWLFRRVMALPIVAPDNADALRTWGLIILALGFILVVASLRLFQRAHTTVLPYANATELVTRGPYRMTRNPMYLGMTVMYLGGTAMINTYWALLFLIIPLVVLNQVIIPYEEKRLHALFGSPYDAYRAHVRRWL